MNIKKHFEYSPSIDLTAAHIGVSKWEWETINKEDRVVAKSIMRKKRYDILPVVNDKGEVVKFYSTSEWNNYENVNINRIEKAPTIYYRLGFSDLVTKFKEENEHYYFLTNGKKILGLVSLVNFNCQAVYDYLFHVIADIERSIGNLLKTHLQSHESEIVEMLEQSSGEVENKIAMEFKESIKNSCENTVFDYMYLETVGTTLEKFHHLLPIEFKRLNKFSSQLKKSGVCHELRNKVMHPVKSIHDWTETIGKMDQLFCIYSEIKEIITC